MTTEEENQATMTKTVVQALLSGDMKTISNMAEQERQPPPPNWNRLRLLMIPFRDLFQLFHTPAEQAFVSIQISTADVVREPSLGFGAPHGLPVGSRCRSVNYDFARQCLMLMVEHESFDAVPDGSVPPMHLADITTLDQVECHTQWMNSARNSLASRITLACKHEKVSGWTTDAIVLHVLGSFTKPLGKEAAP